MAGNLDAGTLRVGVSADGSKNAIDDLRVFQKEVKNTEKQADESTKKIATSFKKMGVALSTIGRDLTMYVTTPIISLGAASFKLASDFQENLNKVDVVFKQNSREIKAWSETSLKAMGMAQSTAMDMAALFGDMGNGMGIESRITKQYAMDLTQLSADMASFKNVSVERSKTALTGIYTGETEALKSLGIVMTEVNLQQFANSKGMDKSIKDMTQAEKVMLRYEYVMSVTADSQGDFVRTQDGAANQMRIFGETLKELGVTFGEVLLPTITELLQKANDMLQQFGELDDETKQQIINFGLMAAAAGPVLMILGKVASGIGSLVKGFGSFKILLGPVGALIAVVVAGLTLWGKYTYEQWDKQQKLNKTLEETNRLLAEGRNASVSDVEDAEKEQYALERKLALHKQSKEELDQNIKKQQELNAQIEQLNYLTSETGGNAEQSQQIAALNKEVGDLANKNLELEDSILKTEKALTDQYGTLDAARGKLGALNKYVVDGAEEQTLLAKITDEATYALNEEANALNESALKASLLVEEYKALREKKEKTADDTNRLVEIESDLNSLLGDSVVIRNQENEIIGISLSLVDKEIKAQGDLSAAKKKAVKEMAEYGAEHVANSIRQVEQVIRALELEKMAMEGIETRSRDGYKDPAKMSTSEKDYWYLQQNNVKKNVGFYTQYLDELKNLKNEVSKVNSSSSTTGDSSNADGTKTAKDANNELEKAIENFEKRKKIGNTIIDNEMYELDVIARKYAKTSDEQLKMREYMLDNFLSVIERKKAAHKLSISQEIQLYDEARDHYALNEEQKVQLDNQIKQMKIDNIREIVEEGKYYGTLSLQEEFEKYMELKELAKGHADEIKMIDQEIFRVKQALLDDEVRAVQKACDDQILARNDSYTKQLEDIDSAYSEEIAELQSKLDKMDYEADQERIKQERQRKQEKVDEAEKRVQNAVTDRERQAAVAELNKAKQDLTNYDRELALKEERRLIQEQMKAAKQKADQEKKDAEKAKNEAIKELEKSRDNQLKILEGQYESEFLLLTGKKGDFKTVEQEITTNVQTELDNRNTAFAKAQYNDLTKFKEIGILLIQQAGIVARGMQSQFNQVKLPSFISTQYNQPTPQQIALAGNSTTNNNTATTQVTNYNNIQANQSVADVINEISKKCINYNRAKGVKK